MSHQSRYCLKFNLTIRYSLVGQGTKVKKYLEIISRHTLQQISSIAGGGGDHKEKQLLLSFKRDVTNRIRLINTHTHTNTKKNR